MTNSTLFWNLHGGVLDVSGQRWDPELDRDVEDYVRRGARQELAALGARTYQEAPGSLQPGGKPAAPRARRPQDPGGALAQARPRRRDGRSNELDGDVRGLRASGLGRLREAERDRRQQQHPGAVHPLDGEGRAERGRLQGRLGDLLPDRREGPAARGGARSQDLHQPARPRTPARQGLRPADARRRASVRRTPRSCRSSWWNTRPIWATSPGRISRRRASAAIPTSATSLSRRARPRTSNRARPSLAHTWHTQDKRPWPTRSGRIQFYIDHDWYLALGEALPTHKAPIKAGGDHPLTMTGGHTRWSIHAMWRTDPLLLRLQRGEPVMWVGAEDATARGIVDGDEVEVANDVGRFFTKVKVSPAVRPGQVIMYHAWENYQFEGGMGLPQRHAVADQPPAAGRGLSLVEALNGHPTAGRERPRHARRDSEDRPFEKATCMTTPPRLQKCSASISNSRSAPAVTAGSRAAACGRICSA